MMKVKMTQNFISILSIPFLKSIHKLEPYILNAKFGVAFDPRIESSPNDIIIMFIKSEEVLDHIINVCNYKAYEIQENYILAVIPWPEKYKKVYEKIKGSNIKDLSLSEKHIILRYNEKNEEIMPYLKGVLFVEKDISNYIKEEYQKNLEVIISENQDLVDKFEYEKSYYFTLGKKIKKLN